MNKLFTTLLIDDEPPARKRLTRLLKKYPEVFDIIGEAENGSQAQEKITELKPDLIFLDIEMPGLTGFQLLEKLEVVPFVIFCTAYDEYALKAFETSSIDYLLKPVLEERLEKTIEKLQKFGNNQSTQQLLEVIKDLSIKKETKTVTSITVKQGDKILFVKLEDIIYLEADEKYVMLNTNRGNYLVSQSLAQLEQKLPDYFLRVNRGVVINTNYVEEVEKYFNSKYIIKLQNKGLTTITSGRAYISQIKKWMDF